MPSRVFMLAPSMGEDYLKANSTSKKSGKLQRTIKWNPPEMGILKIKFNGFVVNSKATDVLIDKDEEGSPIVAGARCLG
ncbi:hypothetical protein ACFX13_013312 [Malus domestica]|uniref:Uncharacterized protein n=1 Tax=Malus domestica TaxID=3750 RepID=A0A498I9G0_MALDO|nr:hypothetical protein DVH24_002145 [Malus domestica]